VLTRKSLGKAWREDFLIGRLLLEKEHKKAAGLFHSPGTRRFGLF
jgi:DNA-binding transcriptional ArsR family regulator